MKLYCKRKDCFDELIGGIAIIIGIIGYIVQLVYTEKTLDISSFSIISLFLVSISELLFVIQGIQKQSITITLTRSMTFISVVTFIVIWFVYN